MGNIVWLGIFDGVVGAQYIHCHRHIGGRCELESVCARKPCPNITSGTGGVHGR